MLSVRYLRELVISNIAAGSEELRNLRASSQSGCEGLFVRHASVGPCSVVIHTGAGPVRCDSSRESAAWSGAYMT